MGSKKLRTQWTTYLVLAMYQGADRVYIESHFNNFAI